MLCRPLQLCASIHLLPGIPFFDTSTNRFPIPRRRQQTCACVSLELSAGASTYNRLERRHRTGFLSGGLERKRWKRKRKTHKPSPARICCCDLVWVSRPWVRVGGSESRYQVGRENRSADLGLVVPLEQGRLAASGKGGFRGRRGRARRLVVLRAARPRGPGPTICRGWTGVLAGDDFLDVHVIATDVPVNALLIWGTAVLKLEMM